MNPNLQFRSRPLNLRVEQLDEKELNIESFSFSAGLPVVDLRSKLPPIWDQGELGSCTAFALCAAFSYCDPSFNGSKLFQYYNCRYLDQLSGDNSVVVDDGTTLRQGVTSLKNYGLCKETSWPYDISKYATKPTAGCYTEALNRQVLTATNVTQTLDQMKACLQSGFPFVIGFMVYDSFFSNNGGNIPLPNTAAESLLGGHAILVVGYDDNTRRWICRNSWGLEWGQSGYFTMPFDYLTNRRLATDAWKITAVENGVAPPPPAPKPTPPKPKPAPFPRPKRRLGRSHPEFNKPISRKI